MYLYHFKKNRKQQAKLFINMGIACWIYILGVFIYDTQFNGQLSSDFKQICYFVMTIASSLLFFVAWRFYQRDGTYEMSITNTTFCISYPGSKKWSFSINIQDIDRIERRISHSHAGKGIPKVGVVTKDGNFYEICLNFFNGEFKAGLNPIKDIHQALNRVYPNISYKVNNTYSPW
ncbi:hypothetical protein [Glaciecola sp. 1036]|uniref:hypothetical protein n=1 Tax=Alteromonadaceae TaxID=72275 RepID=UPI003D06A74E